MQQLRRKIKSNNDCFINLPASKSISNRLLVLEFIYGKNFNIQNLSNSNDTLIFKRLLKQIAENNSSDKEMVLDCEDCGAAYRFIVAVSAVTNGFWRITGKEILKKRPIKWLVDVLNEMSMQIRSTKAVEFADNGDLLIKGGKLAAIDIHAGSKIESSQFLSALALIQSKVDGNFKISVADDMPSKSYFDMTLKLINQVENNICNFNVEADWSSCSYFLAAMLLNNKIDECFFTNLKFSGLQGDQAVANIFKNFGFNFNETNTNTLATKSAFIPISTLQHNFSDCPDLYPTLKILSWILGLNTNFTGIENQIHKESNRIANIENEIQNLSKNPDNYVLNTYNDHRLAMAFALLKLKNPKTKIENPDCVKKSFPDFWQEYEKMLTLQ